MKLIRASLLCVATATALSLPQSAGAVRQWLLPSETMFVGSGNEWLTVDAAISTDLYYFDHPGQDWDATVTAPDGTVVPVENRMVGKLRQTFDVPITMKGTYRLTVAFDQVMGGYLLNGERKMLPRGTTPATLKAAIPDGATDVQTAEANSRIETFVTAGAPTADRFVASGRGLEMVPVTHPNDVVAGEAASFRFLLDGKPAAGLDVVAIPGGVRYRRALDQIEAKTDAEGKVSLILPHAGMYWINVTTGGRRAAPPAGSVPAFVPPERRASYAMVIEVQG